MPENRKLRHRTVDSSRKLFVHIRKVNEDQIAERKPRGATAKGIPTPFARIVEARHSDIHRQSLPDHYVHSHLCSGADLTTEGESYDLLNDDMDWLAEVRKSEGLEDDPIASEKCMEDLINLFERETGKGTTSYDPSEWFTKEDARNAAVMSLDIRGEFTDLVYDYWVQKRATLGKALLRQFQEYPNIDDPSPHVAFRPRERERRVSVRNPRKNDWNSYDKLSTLHNDVRNVGNLMDFIITRENFKRNQQYLEAEAFDEKLKLMLQHKKKHMKVLGSLCESSLPRSEYLDDLKLEELDNLVSQNTSPEMSSMMNSSKSNMLQSFAHIPALAFGPDEVLRKSDVEHVSEKRMMDQLSALVDPFRKSNGILDVAVLRRDRFGYLNVEVRCISQ